MCCLDDKIAVSANFDKLSLFNLLDGVNGNSVVNFAILLLVERLVGVENILSSRLQAFSGDNS